MAKYRIKEYDYGTHKRYCVQKKLIFDIWLNTDNIDANITGVYDTLQEAKDVIKSKLTKIKTKIIYINK